MEVIEEAESQGMVVAPGRCFTPATIGKRDNRLRLTFADKSPEQLDEAAHLLGEH